MLQAASVDRKRTDGRGNHLYQANRKAAPRQIAKRLAPYGRARDILFPWSIYEYPGALRGLVAILSNRASIHAVRDWCRGRRRPPQWAYALLAAAIERRIADLQHALALIKKEAGD